VTISANMHTVPAYTMNWCAQWWSHKDWTTQKQNSLVPTQVYSGNLWMTNITMKCWKTAEVLCKNQNTIFKCLQWLKLWLNTVLQMGHHTLLCKCFMHRQRAHCHTSHSCSDKSTASIDHDLWKRTFANIICFIPTANDELILEYLRFLIYSMMLSTKHTQPT
jgi:hypothetical protein